MPLHTNSSTSSEKFEKANSVEFALTMEFSSYIFIKGKKVASIRQLNFQVAKFSLFYTLHKVRI